MRRGFRTLCFVICVLEYAHVACAQLPSMNSLNASGTVFADGGAPRLQGVQVRLCDSYGKIMTQSATSASGQFSFDGLRQGMYVLQLEAAGFQNAEVRLDMGYSSQSGLTIYLKPLNQGPLPLGEGASIAAHELAMPAGARNLYREGKKKLYEENKAQEALTDFQQALAQGPDFYEARYQVGMALVALGNMKEAEKSFRQCIERSNDKYGSANIAWGTLQVDRGETESGEKQIRRGLQLSPSAWMGYYQLGKLQALRGHLDEAEKLAEQARQFAPATAIVYQLLANIHLKQKNYAALLEDVDAYVRLDPDSAAGRRAKELREQVRKQIEEEAAKR